MKNKVFSKIEDIPNGTASNIVVEGCMVLEGGAFRGVYAEGVLDYLMQHDINMRCTVGVSAGAINGINYVSGQIGRSARTNLRFRHDKRYIGIGAVRKNSGIVGFDFMYNELEKFDPLDRERLFDPSRRLIAVATNCLTGEATYFDKDTCSDILQAVRASASLPYVSKMVDIDGEPYLDGGCACKIPYQWAIDNGFEKIVVIKTREDGFRKEVSDSESSRLTNTIYRNYPKFASVLARCDIEYNRQCDEIEQLRNEGRIFVISPSEPVDVSRMESDMEKLGTLYFLGYSDAQRQFKALKKYLNIDAAL